MNNNLNDERFGLGTTVNSESSCVAWFKLAELLTRKEKEKALSLYRLLSHSFEDKAYALQLEADILWSLEDEQALEKYEQAAYLYKKEKKIVSATAVYEHLLILQPKKLEFISSLLVLYVLLAWPGEFEKKYLYLLSNYKNEVFSQDQVMTITKNLINFNVQNKTDLKLLDENRDFSWILQSLAAVLKDPSYSKVKEQVIDYCLELNLNFDS